MEQGRKIVVWCTICLILCGQCLAKDGTKNINREKSSITDEDGAVEVEDAEGVLQQLDEALDSGIISEIELTHTLKNTFKINEKEWRVLVEQHDADGDGKLAADELLSVAEHLTNKHGEWPIEEKQPLNGAQTGLYAIIGIILLYVIYVGWRHRQENAGIVHGPDESALRQARVAVLSRPSSYEERVGNFNQQNRVSNERELREAMNRNEQTLRRRRFGDDNEYQDPAKKRQLVDKRDKTDDIHPHSSVQDNEHCENKATTNQTEDTSANHSSTQANLEGNSGNTIVKAESLSTTTSDASLDVSPSSSPPHETTNPKNKPITVPSTTPDVSPSSIPSSETARTEKSNSNRPTKLDGISGKTSPSLSPLSEKAQTGKSNFNGPTKLDGISGETLFKQESMSTTGTSSSDVSPSLSPSSETKTIKKPSPRKPDAPRKNAHPDITGDDLLLYILSKVFNLKVEIRKSGVKTGWTPGTMSIKVTDLPGRVEDVHMKMFVLFERRLSRHYSSKVKFCVSCFYNCLDLKGYYADEIVNKMVSSASSLCISTILQQLQEEEEETNEEDDLYSDLAHTSESFEKMEIVSFLLRVAGWSDDGVNISLDLLDEIVTYATKNENATQAMAKVLKSAGNVLKSVQRLDELQLMHGKTLKGLEHLLSQPALPELLSKILYHEVDQASSSLGIYFQRQSVLGSLLSITTIPPSLVEGTKMNSPSLQPWITLRGFPQRPNYDELKNLESRMQEQLHIIQQLVFSVLKRMMKSNRETALAWLATLINMNEMRTSVTPQIQPVASHSIQAACSDSYMLNICAVLIELCLPFCKGDITKLDKIDASYSASPACRLNYDFETCLAGGQIVQEGDGKSSTSGRLPESLKGRFNFMTEILHLTVRAMNVGFLPAKNHYSKLQQQLMHSLKAVSGNKAAEADIRARHLAFSLQWETHLLDPEILRKGSELYLTVAIWLQLQLEKSAKGANGEVETEKRQRKVFSQIPEHCVKDMAQWFWFIASHGLMVHPRALAGLQLAPFVDVCVYLLRRPDLVPGPIPAYRITQALLAFVSTSNRNREQQRGWGSGVVSELAAMVHACPTVQEHLGPALLHNYISVDVVEGLDVDKEDFDKYSARAEIARLLQNLWERLDCRSSVLKLCGSEKFQSFLGAIIDTLLYQLHDSLARLANVRKLERSREDEAAWNALSYKEQEASETFRKNEERVATGFMSMARETLGLIDLISKSEEVARCFTIMPLARRAASTFIGFLESLCGSKSATFKVKDMEKYRFNPRELLSQIAQILLRIVHEERSRELHFVKSMAADPDYSPATMQKACDTLRSKNILEETAVKEFETLNEEVSILREAIQAESSSPSPGAGGDDWQSAIDKEQIDETELENSYTEEMVDLRFDSAELQDNHCYQSNATHALDARSRQAKALIKEMKQWAEILPVHPHAAVFVRQDEERMDMVRALVTGPRDTPYSLGCFVFDIYFPSQYPNIPPLVKFTTTGNGTVRFNPNLYADGKVCLSLLGTFYSGDSSQKWLPNTSSLYQVMVSIQSMILIPDPMYNEPGYEGMRDTQEGEARSREYNARLRLMTIRHAMLGQLRNPPVGFEEVIRKHFRLQYKAVLKQCSQWLRESEGQDEERKLRRVIDELRSELKKLTDDDNTESTEHQDEGDN